MKAFPHTARKQLFILAAVLILTAACGGAPAAAPAGDLTGLTQDEIATLSSLEKVADYPLYVMHYAGAYDYPRTWAGWPAQPRFACSLFAALSPEGDMLYGRNFDWEFSPSLLLYTDPPDGYASISMVDLAFLDIDPKDAGSLADLPLKDRTGLLAAPAMPFDGMNEHGLAVAMAAVPETGRAEKDPAKSTIDSIGIIREILDHARTVDEALLTFEQYNIDMGGGPPIHYLIADKSGKAVLVELIQGEVVTLPNEEPWHMATNHFRCSASAGCSTAGDGGCPRYRLLAKSLTEAGGRLDEKGALGLLSGVAQGNTQWSVVYNMSEGDISVVVGQNFEKVYTFRLNTH